ncbi:MAG TPA: hydroxymethylbilane synthase [Acidimicrobiia bacterium]|nr:hydroxymethylbilane synthase [Acidimicrobiia bacterium]
MTAVLRVATRGSALARSQTDRVIAALGVDAEPVIVQTRGDKDRTSPIHVIAGTGVFVKEVQEAVLDHRADLAVHSAKDLPARPVDGLVIGAFPKRGDPRDALVGSTLAGLGAGATVATGSVRRRAQLANLRPDLTFAELRGNVATRIDKAAEFAAVVIAFAALERLDLTARAAEVLDPTTMLPQVGQGALAVECRADDAEVRDRLAAVDDAPTRAAVEAERAYLAELGSGCDLPIGALAHWFPDDTVTLHALLASVDGHIVLRATITDSDPVAAGRAAAEQLLHRDGGASLLADAGLRR